MYNALLILIFIFPALVIMGGVYDASTMKIPNWISITLAAAFVPVALLTGLGWAEIGISVGVGFAALVIGIALFAFRVVGGGDAKLLAASCLWIGWPTVGMFVLYTALAGGLLSLLLIMARKWVAFVPAAHMPGWFQRLMEPKGDIPYGIAIAVGAVLAYPASAIVALVSAY